MGPCTTFRGHTIQDDEAVYSVFTMGPCTTVRGHTMSIFLFLSILLFLKLIKQNIDFMSIPSTLRIYIFWDFVYIFAYTGSPRKH